jgi:uncharacterized protein (TIGR02246 family)
MDDLERLVALQDIRDLVVTYAMAFDDHDWDRLGTVFTEDASWVGPGHEFAGKPAILEFMRTCLPDDYESKHMNPQTFVRFADDGQSAVADSDVVWIAQNFENQIVARYHDDVVKQHGRWLIKRREEQPLTFRAGPPPMSDTAMSVSAGTLKE